MNIPAKFVTNCENRVDCQRHPSKYLSAYKENVITDEFMALLSSASPTYIV